MAEQPAPALPDAAEIGRRITLMREAAGLSGAEAARRGGIEQPNLIRLEHGGRGTRNPRGPAIETVLNLALAWGITPGQFIAIVLPELGANRGDPGRKKTSENLAQPG